MKLTFLVNPRTSSLSQGNILLTRGEKCIRYTQQGDNENERSRITWTRNRRHVSIDTKGQRLVRPITVGAVPIYGCATRGASPLHLPGPRDSRLQMQAYLCRRIRH